MRLAEKFEVSDMARVYRFELPQADKPIGVPLLNYVKLRVNGIERRYVPISPNDQEGFVDIIVKMNDKPDGMPQVLDKLVLGEPVEIAGPFGAVSYHGCGEFRFTTVGTDGEKTETTRVVKRVGAMIGGSGITSVFGMINHVLETRSEQLHISLINYNKTEQQILLQEPLDLGAINQLIHLHQVLERPPEIWTQGTGMTSFEHLDQFLPSPSDEEALILYCGPPAMDRRLKALLSEYGSKAVCLNTLLE